MIHPVIFTYSADASCAVEAAGAAMDAGLKAPWVFNDKARPADKLTVEILREMGCEIRDFVRPLNGISQFGREAAFGIAEAYDEVMRTTGDEYVIKLDSDTIILRINKYKEAITAGAIGAAACWGEYAYYGCCSMISRKGVDVMLDFHTKKLPMPADLTEHWCSQDILEYHVLKDAGKLVRWPFENGVGFFAGYSFADTRMSMAEYAARYDVTSFGQWTAFTGEPHERRVPVARAMSAYRTIYRNRKQ